MRETKVDKVKPAYANPVSDIGSVDAAVDVYRRTLEPTKEEKQLCSEIAARVASTRAKYNLD